MRLSRTVIFLGGSALATAQLLTIDPATDTTILHRSSHWGDQLDRTEHQGSTVSFAFTGTSLKIVLGAWRDYGDVSILLDGQTIKVTTYSNTTHVGSMTAFNRNDLSPASHNVVMTLLGPSAGGGTSDSGQAWLVIQSISYTLASLPPSLPPSPPPQSSAPASPSSSSQRAPASSAPTQNPSSPPPSSTPTPSSSSVSKPSSSDPSTTPTVTADGERPSSSPPTQSSTSSPSSAEVDSETASAQSKPNDKTVVIGAVVGGILALVLAALCSFWLFTRRGRQRPRSEPLLLVEIPVTGSSSLNLATGYNTPSEKVPRRMAAPQSTVEPTSPSTVFGRGRPARDVGGTLSPNSSGSHYDSTPSASGTDSDLRAELAELREMVKTIVHPPTYTQ